MALFQKKYCDICGNEIKFLGNRKLTDGNMCKDCAAKLSPWFSERRSSTIEEINQQLAYRAENQTAVNNFHPTTILGNSTKVYADEAARKFAVTASSNWRSVNPDIIDYSQVNDVVLEINESKHEIMQETEDGKKVSFDPPQYSYEYRFYIVIYVNSPWFDDIRFSLSSKNPDNKFSDEYLQLEYLGKQIQHLLRPDLYAQPQEPTTEEEVVDPIPLTPVADSDEWTCSCGNVNNGGKFCAACGKERAIRWYCPECGKENYGKFCIACGTSKPEFK